MITKIILWYLIGVIFSYLLLCIGNTIAYKTKKGKAKLIGILSSWVIVIVYIMMIIDMIMDIYNPFEKIKKFFNQEPDFVKNKNK